MMIYYFKFRGFLPPIFLCKNTNYQYQKSITANSAKIVSSDNFLGLNISAFVKNYFSDYSHNKNLISQKGWENYYNEHFGFSKLTKVFEIIKENATLLGC